MKNFKRTLAIIFAAIMILTVIPFSVSAEYNITFSKMGKYSNNLNVISGTVPTLHFDVTPAKGITITGYKWMNATKQGYTVIFGSDLTSLSTKPIDYQVKNGSGIKYYVYYVEYTDSEGDAYYAFETVMLSFSDGFTINPTTSDFSGYGFYWTKDTKTLTFETLGILDATARTGNMFHFVGMDATIDCQGLAVLIANRPDGLIYFENPSNDTSSSCKLTITGSNTTSMLGLSNLNNAGLCARGNRGKCDIDITGNVAVSLSGAKTAGLSGNNMGTMTIKNTADVSFDTSTKTLDAVNGVKIALGTGRGVIEPNTVVVKDGKSQNSDGKGVVPTVKVGKTLVLPTITKQTSGTIYVPTNSKYEAVTKATLPAGEGPVKYWWAYDMHGDLKTWSNMGELSENGGKRTFEFNSSEKTYSYKCDVWNNTDGNTIVTTDPVTFVSVKNPFNDVSANQWYTSGVLYCYKNGLVSGTSADKFGVSSPLTRASFVQILAKVAGVDLTKVKYTDTFKDVPEGQWFTNAVLWAYQNGYTSGLSATQFGPNSAVTREQLAVFLRTYATKQKIDCSKKADITKYSDYNKIAEYAKDAFAWAVKSGMISGTSATTLSPKTTATRGQVVVIMKAFVENVLGK